MKSEERHQLLTNDLGVVTNKTVGFLERHLEAVIATACAVAVIVGIAIWWSQGSGSDTEAAWTLLDSAQTVQDLGIVQQRFSGKPPGQWAMLKVAEKTLEEAMPLVFSNRELAVAGLKSARDGFESLVQDKDKTVPPAIRERALWGLANCLETLCDGDTSKPIEALERLLTDFPDTAFKTVAEERIAALRRPEAADFYSWFSKEDPKPADARPDSQRPLGGFQMPPPAPNGARPEDSSSTPSDAQQPANSQETSGKTESSANPDGKTGNEKGPDTPTPAADQNPASKEPTKDDQKPVDKK